MCVSWGGLHGKHSVFRHVIYNKMQEVASTICLHKWCTLIRVGRSVTYNSVTVNEGKDCSHNLHDDYHRNNNGVLGVSVCVCV